MLLPLLLLLSPAWAGSGGGRTIDLSWQFADAATRDQGNVGSCHAFGTVALLEAAWMRQYREPVRLSEADLFLQKTVLSGEIYDSVQGRVQDNEGGDPVEDIRFVLKHGVATDLGYADFLKRYQYYRRDANRMMVMIRELAPESAEDRRSFLARWRELRTSPEYREAGKLYLGAKDQRIEEERRLVKDKLNGFKLESREFDVAPDVRFLDSKDCLAKGEEQFAYVVSELRAGRPVSVGMELAGLRAWGRQNDKGPAGHAFLIIGVQDGKDFVTRNSWGGSNPKVRAWQMCRVMQAATVLAPRD